MQIKMNEAICVSACQKNMIEKLLNKGHRGDFSTILVHFDLRREDNLSIRDKLADPNVSIIQRFRCISHNKSHN